MSGKGKGKKEPAKEAPKAEAPKAEAAKAKAPKAEAKKAEVLKSNAKKGDLKLFKTEGHHKGITAAVNVGVSVPQVACEVVFRNVDVRLRALIAAQKSGGFILGAIAWLSSLEIVQELAEAKARGVLVMIVVQKEDFLRADQSSDQQNPKSAYWSALRKAYGALGKIGTDYNNEECQILGFAEPFLEDKPTGQWHFGDEITTLDAVRCVGHHNSDKDASFPRMHNKFFVFGEFSVVGEFSEVVECNPTTVWTGSFNCSKAARESFENAVILTSPTVADAYTAEFALLFLLSESLDWTSPWMAPELSFYST